jgi:hypothetical protein
MQKASEPKEKKLALIIRCHGIITINKPTPEDIRQLEAANAAVYSARTVEEMRAANERANRAEQVFFFKKVNVVDYKRHFNIGSMVNIGLAKLGNICIGSSDIPDFLQKVGRYYASDVDLRKKTIEEKIKEVFIDARPPSSLQPAKHSICGITAGRCDFELKPIPLKDHYIDKYYTKYDENSGVFVLFHSGFEPEEILEIKNLLKEVSQILINGVNKSYILSKLTKFNISKLFFCDFTCNGYHGLTPEESSIMTKHLEFDDLRGGKKKKRRTKKNRTKKYKK